MEHLIIRHCAPTLAGIKTGCLFSCPIGTKSQLHAHLTSANRQLNGKDVFVDVLRARGERALILVYRGKRLEKALQDKNILDFLAAYGYRRDSVGYCIRHLKKRFAAEEKFPHEIGVFLGYPLADVAGFIENGGKKCKHSGCWKVYGDECKAVKMFERYNKCKRIYLKLFSSGRSLDQLTVAA